MLAKSINEKRAQELIDAGAVLVDVRDPVSFRDSAKPGAINVPLRNVSSLFRYPRATKFVFYGSKENDENLGVVINYMMQQGFEHLYTLKVEQPQRKLRVERRPK